MLFRSCLQKYYQIYKFGFFLLLEYKVHSLPHMINIVGIIEKATSDSLILLDELCSGTDPQEGANLAISILEELNQKKSLNIITTHYSEIKNYAIVTDNFENASSEFDVENMKPTYKILMGVPGRSNAFAISKRLGLNERI